MVELALSGVGCVLLCYTLGRYNRTLALQRWQFVLNVPEQRALESLKRRFELDGALARQALVAAERARQAKRTPDALTVLRVALQVLEEAGADRRTRLRAMAVYSRMVQAIRPLPAPSAAPFRGGTLRASAAAAGLVHRLLVGTQERFRLWLVLIGLGVRIVLHGGRRAVEDDTRQPERSRVLPPTMIASLRALRASTLSQSAGEEMPAPRRATVSILPSALAATLTITWGRFPGIMAGRIEIKMRSFIYIIRQIANNGWSAILSANPPPGDQRHEGDTPLGSAPPKK